MPPGAYPHSAFRLLFTCLLFSFIAYILTASGAAMFTDTDPLWHLAAGDLIRQIHSIPTVDPWSFTAGKYRWLNISWGWDTAMSWVHDTGGWHAMIALNALTIAAIIAVVFYTCLTYSGSFLASLAATVGAITLLSLSLRPLQVSNLMVALWFLLLGLILRKRLSPLWLLLFPLLSLLWVNIHGGFIMVPLLLGAFLLQAALRREARLANALLGSLLTCTAVLSCNPYGLEIIEAVRRPLATVANRFILEWQPFSFTAANMVSHLDVFAFLLVAFLPTRKLLPAERYLALLWCALSFTANRYLSIFAILGAPTLACAVAAILPSQPSKLTTTLLNAYDKKPLAYSVLAASMLLAAWLPTASASAYLKQQFLAPNHMAEEINFMKQYPSIHFLTHFNLAAIVAYETRGEVPVFVDPRTETAFPPEILQAYLQFHYGLPGWQELLTDYDIGGVVLPLPGHDPENDAILQRFHAMPGWYAAFTGPTAIVFLRQ